MEAEEIFEDLKVDFLRGGHHHCRPGWVQLRNCPFCASDNYHLGYNLAAGFFACWKCGYHHLDQTLIALGLARNKARDLGRSITLATPVSRHTRQVSLSIPPNLGVLQGAHRRYLRRRGFDPKEVERIWHIKGIGISNRLSWRIYIPIFFQENVVSWTTRSISDKVIQRYISASTEQEQLSHKHLVYGQDYCRHSVVIVEGPLDAWRIGPGAGALFGTAFTTAQVCKLAKYPYRYIVFDSSKEAQRRATELAEQLSAFQGVTETIELDAEDPGSASPKEIRRLRDVTKL